MKEKNINDELRQITSRLQLLDAEKEALQQRKQRLENQQHVNSSETHLFSVNQKVALFQDRFQGRTDIYATQWQNAKGRSGYSVACHHEWRQGLCNKPTIKCSECINKKYKVFDEQAIYDHLAIASCVSFA